MWEVRNENKNNGIAQTHYITLNYRNFNHGHIICEVEWTVSGIPCGNSIFQQLHCKGLHLQNMFKQDGLLFQQGRMSSVDLWVKQVTRCKIWKCQTKIQNVNWKFVWIISAHEFSVVFVGNQSSLISLRFSAERVESSFVFKTLYR